MAKAVILLTLALLGCATAPKPEVRHQWGDWFLNDPVAEQKT